MSTISRPKSKKTAEETVKISKNRFDALCVIEQKYNRAMDFFKNLEIIWKKEDGCKCLFCEGMNRCTVDFIKDEYRD